MKRYIYIFLLILLPIMVGAKGPLYIVDRQDGVSREKLPPADSIASMSVMDSAEAVSIYGERASGGVVVIHTKSYMRYMSNPMSRQNDTILAMVNQYEKKLKTEQNRRRIVLLVFLLSIVLLFFAAKGRWTERISNRLGVPDVQHISDEDYRQIVADSPHAIVPETLLRRGIDPLFAEAAMYIVGTGRANSAALQKYFEIEKKRADKLVKQIESERIIGHAEENGDYELPYTDMAELEPLFDKLGIEWK